MTDVIIIKSIAVLPSLILVVPFTIYTPHKSNAIWETAILIFWVQFLLLPHSLGVNVENYFGVANRQA